VLPPREFQRWSSRADRHIVEGVRAKMPVRRSSAFPERRRAVAAYVDRPPASTPSASTGRPSRVDRGACRTASPFIGNLDPLVLIAGGAARIAPSMTCWRITPAARLIFNLGHGSSRKTPIAHVEQMIKAGAGYRG